MKTKTNVERAVIDALRRVAQIKHYAEGVGAPRSSVEDQVEPIVARLAPVFADASVDELSEAIDRLCVAGLADAVAEVPILNGQQIRRLRAAVGLTQAGLAALLEVAPLQVKRWENDKATPRERTRRRIAKVARDAGVILEARA